MLHGTQELAQWLQAQQGNTLFIQKAERLTGKHEFFDIDHIELELEKVSVRNKDRPDPDNYISNQEILLHGTGKIKNEQGEVDLPLYVYEIPVYDNMSAIQGSRQLQLETKRAIYSISIQ